jgi:hypothetical protein
MRDQPTRQKVAVAGILRLARTQPAVQVAARDALLMLPPEEVTIATPLLFAATDSGEVRSVLSTWRGQIPAGPVRTAIQTASNQGQP